MRAYLKVYFAGFVFLACLQQANASSSASGSKRKSDAALDHAWLAQEQKLAKWKEVSTRLFAKNKLSARDAMEMMQSAKDAGAQGGALC